MERITTLTAFSTREKMVHLQHQDFFMRNHRTTHGKIKSWKKREQGKNVEGYDYI